MAHQRPITPKEMEDLKEQLEHLRGDRDRSRVINTAGESFQFTTAQLVELVQAQHYGEAQRMTAVSLYPQLVDPENFEKVLACYKFAEDRQEIKEALGL